MLRQCRALAVVPVVASLLALGSAPAALATPTSVQDVSAAVGPYARYVDVARSHEVGGVTSVAAGR